MESVAPHRDQNTQPKLLHNQHQLQPTTSQPVVILPHQPHTTKSQIRNDQQQSSNNSYQVKCGLLEYHIQEAVLINKALRSELKQYKDKIDFEKKLRKFLVSRVKDIDS